MNLDIFITDYLSSQATTPADTLLLPLAGCQMLRCADWQLLPQAPLHYLFNRLQSGGCHPAQAPSMVARILAQRLQNTDAPAFCLLPVSLGLQRDTYALQQLVVLERAAFQSLTALIQQHFAADFTLHADPVLRYWWVVPKRPLQATVGWPQQYLFQRAMAWQAAGPDAQQIRQWTNEIQMLLHQHATVETAAVAWPAALNSLWFASVPVLPQWTQDLNEVVGAGAVFDGLCHSGLPGIRPGALSAYQPAAAARQGVMVVDDVSQVPWSAINAWVGAGRLSRLRLTLPLAERSLQIDLRRAHRWQFWRQRRTLAQHLQTLLQQLPANTLDVASVSRKSA